MRKYIFLLFIGLGLALAGPALAQEAIDDFSVTINVNADTSLDISESITYDFGTGQKSGFSRDIPFKYKTRGKSYNLKLTDFSVTNRAGEAFAFVIKEKDGYKNITIGDRAGYVTGEITYIISYRAKGAIKRGSDQDELYWDVTGSKWAVPIRQSRASIVFPASSKEEFTRAECSAGPAGGGGKCVSYRYQYSGQGQVSGLVFTDDYLEPGSGLTVAAGFSKGVIKARSWLSIIFAFI